jgi:hypothetical protein
MPNTFEDAKYYVVDSSYAYTADMSRDTPEDAIIMFLQDELFDMGVFDGQSSVEEVVKGRCPLVVEGLNPIPVNPRGLAEAAKDAVHDCYEDNHTLDGLNSFGGFSEATLQKLEAAVSDMVDELGDSEYGDVVGRKEYSFDAVMLIVYDKTDWMDAPFPERDFFRPEDEQ